jgi:hypothetical protein
VDKPIGGFSSINKLVITLVNHLDGKVRLPIISKANVLKILKLKLEPA